VHRGSIEAAGLLVPLAPIGTSEGMRRVIAAWRPGTRVWAHARGFVVVWPVAVRVRSEDAPGEVLVMRKRALTAVPLTQDELEALSPPLDTVVVARGGEAHADPLGAEVDPSSWIDVGALALESAAPLTVPVTQAIRTAEVASEEHVEQALRAPVGKVPPARGDVMKAIAGARSGQGPAKDDGAGAGSAGRRFLVAVGAALLNVLLAPFSGAGTSTGTDASAQQDTRTARSLAVHRATPPSRFEAFGARLQRLLRHLAAQTLMRLRLARFVGRWHAEYLAKMLDLFERGDLDEALRHAIPLGGQPAEHVQPALLPPRPRDTLALAAGPRRTATAIGLVDDLYATLRQRYRAAFEKLDRQGDVDRAAFVLAELLQLTAEAVAYLEKHKRFALAAELAEARGLPAEYAVRLWFRAGQRRRAIALARRQDCFAMAVERLEREDREAGQALRLEWADACASAGDYLGAAQVARNVDAAKNLVRSWVERALELGGATASTASVLKLEIDGDAFAEVCDRMNETLCDPSPLALPAKQAFYAALQGSSAPGATVLARAAARAALADRLRTPRSVVEGLVSKAGDPSLRLHALRPATVQRPTMPPPSGEAKPIVHQRTASDSGGLAIADAALVTGNRVLVALGELGVRLLALDGRTVARFDAPASALVVSSRGDRALAVMGRDGALEVARIDLVRRRVQRWGVLEASAFARSFDGALWFVGRGAGVLALDATVDGFDATWETTLREREVSSLFFQERWLTVIGETPQPPLFEVYELPKLTLRERREIPDAVGGLGSAAGAGAQRVFQGVEPPLDLRTLCAEQEPLQHVTIDVEDEIWCVSGQGADGRFVVRSGIRVPGGPAAETSVCMLDDRPGTRIGGHVLVVFDRRGRLLVLDPTSGEPVAEVVLRV
jgi:hypothetical protein